MRLGLEPFRLRPERCVPLKQPEPERSGMLMGSGMEPSISPGWP